MSKLLFPMNDAQNYLSKCTSDIERDGNILRWPYKDGVTELRVDPGLWTSADGLVVREVVTLTHTMPAIQELSVAQIAKWNRLAVLGAYIPEDSAGPARSVTKVGIFEGDREAAELLYAPLVCAQASLCAWHATCLAREVWEADPQFSPLSMVDQDPPYDPESFRELALLADKHGSVNTRGDGEFTAEFPWEPGSLSHMFNNPDLSARLQSYYRVSDEELPAAGGLTSLLIMRIASHPLHGRGVHCTLELPVLREEPGALDLVTSLNRWELAIPDLPPHFGAWAVGERAPTYVCFVPTLFSRVGLLNNLFIWMRVRAERARAWYLA